MFVIKEMGIHCMYVARAEASLHLYKIVYVKKAARPIDSPHCKLSLSNVQGTMVNDTSRIIEFVKTVTAVSTSTLLYSN